jgi:hypothetical protein
LDLNQVVKTLPRFLEKLELKILTRQLTASSRFGENRRKEENLILKFFPFFKQLI